MEGMMVGPTTLLAVLQFWESMMRPSFGWSFDFCTKRRASSGKVGSWRIHITSHTYLITLLAALARQPWQQSLFYPRQRQTSGLRSGPLFLCFAHPTWHHTYVTGSTVLFGLVNGLAYSVSIFNAESINNINVIILL